MEEWRARAVLIYSSWLTDTRAKFVGGTVQYTPKNTRNVGLETMDELAEPHGWGPERDFISQIGSHFTRGREVRFRFFFSSRFDTSIDRTIRFNKISKCTTIRNSFTQNWRHINLTNIQSDSHGGPYYLKLKARQYPQVFGHLSFTYLHIVNSPHVSKSSWPNDTHVRMSFWWDAILITWRRW